MIGGSRSGGITFAIVSGPDIEGYAVDDEAIGDGIPLPDAAGPVLIELWSMNLGTSFCSVIDAPRGHRDVVSTGLNTSSTRAIAVRDPQHESLVA